MSRRQLALDPVLASETPMREASQLGRSLVRAILKFERIEHRCATIALDVAHEPPRLHDWDCEPSGARPTGRASCTFPSKRGTPRSSEMATSSSAVSG